MRDDGEAHHRQAQQNALPLCLPNPSQTPRNKDQLHHTRDHRRQRPRLSVTFEGDPSPKVHEGTEHDNRNHLAAASALDGIVLAVDEVEAEPVEGENGWSAGGNARSQA